MNEETPNISNYMNYKIKLTVTDPDTGTDKHLSASTNLNLIQDLKVMHGISVLDEMLYVLVDELKNAEFNESRLNTLKENLSNTLNIKKALEDLDAEYSDKESTEYKLKRNKILESL